MSNNTMKNNGPTKTSTTIALFLMVTMAITLVALPVATGQTGTMKTYAYINAVPNPVGVGQEVLLHLGITHPLALQPEGWEGLTVTVIKPDNTTQTLGPFRTDSTGGTGAVLVPDQVGTYKLQTHFPSQKMVPAFTFPATERTYAASDSEWLNL